MELEMGCSHMMEHSGRGGRIFKFVVTKIQEAIVKIKKWANKLGLDKTKKSFS